MNKLVVTLAIILCIFFATETGGNENAGKIWHKIKWGETLSLIARIYGDSVKGIKDRNGLQSDNILTGQIIAISPQPRKVVASWYGGNFHGNPMANGEIYDMYDPTVVAHKYLPLGTLLRVLYPKTGRVVHLVVQDRGPYIRGRSLDLSYQAAKIIGLIEEGVDQVEYRVIFAPI